MLCPGEVSTAANAFEVLAFAGATWSWSSTQATRQARLASALKGSYDSTGRQVGRAAAGGQLHRNRPGSAAAAGDSSASQRMQLRRGSPEREAVAARAAARVGEVAGLAEALYGKDGGVGGFREKQLGVRSGTAGGTRPATARPVSAGAGSSRRLDGTGTAAATAVAGAALQPSTEENLAEARAWVDNWPEAAGHTCLLNALKTAGSYRVPVSDSRYINSSSSRIDRDVYYSGSTSFSSSDCGSNWTRSDVLMGGGSDVDVGTRCVSGASGATNDPDCWYLFSDGLADDGAKCLEWVEEQQAAGRPVPPIHTVGKHDGIAVAESATLTAEAVSLGANVWRWLGRRVGCSGHQE